VRFSFVAVASVGSWPISSVPTYGPGCNNTAACLNPPRFDKDVVGRKLQTRYRALELPSPLSLNPAYRTERPNGWRAVAGFRRPAARFVRDYAIRTVRVRSSIVRGGYRCTVSDLQSAAGIRGANARAAADRYIFNIDILLVAGYYTTTRYLRYLYSNCST
jgi:hypothetical protein